MPEERTNLQTLPDGYRLGDYIIDHALGQGGFGITYLATDCDTGGKVVIKENLPRDFAFRDSTSRQVLPTDSTRKNREDFEWALRSFYNEAQILSSLDHPNIVKVLRAFHALGTAYYVMPHVGGLSLDKWVEAKGAPDAAAVVQLLSALLGALEYLHAGNLLHRDIKPSNVIMKDDGAPVLIDFGSARQIISERTLTKVASPGYTPFEQLQTHGKVGPWTDLYALGATAYRIITGERPADCNDRMENEECDPHVPLCAQPAYVSRYGKQLLASIDKALLLNRAERWQSAAEWRTELERIATAKSRWKKVVVPVAAVLVLGGLGLGAFLCLPASKENPEAPAPASASAPVDGAKLSAMLVEAVSAGDVQKAKCLLDQGADANTTTAMGDSLVAIAIKSDNLPMLSLLLDHGVDVRADNCFRLTPLGYASHMGRTEMVRTLLANGADVHAQTRAGEPALFNAVDSGNVETTRLLLESGASVDFANRDGETPLHRAAYGPSAEMVKLLLDNKADINVPNGLGNTPLHAAAMRGRTDSVRLLLSRGADAGAKNHRGETPLRMAEQGRFFDTVDCLSGKDGAAASGKSSAEIAALNQALVDAVKISDTAEVESLLDSGVDVNAKDVEGATPLHHAAFMGDADVVRLLLARGADTAARTDMGDTPLHHAARWGYKEVVALLLDGKADANAKEQGGKTPLHLAAAEDHSDVASLLLERGAQINALDNRGQTPLDLAVSAAKDAVATFLRGKDGKCAADILPDVAPAPAVSASQGERLLAAAAAGNTQEVAALLKDGADPDTPDPRTAWTPLHHAAYYGQVRMAELLLEHKADIEARTSDGDTPLHKAAVCRGDLPASGKDAQAPVAITRLLLDNGADANAMDNYETTPLHCAASEGRADVVKLLLARGAKVWAKDADGRTALHAAAGGGRTDNARVLLEGKADVHARDNGGKTPLHCAACNKTPDMAALLLEHQAQINAKDKQGKTPLQAALDAGASATADFLRTKGAK